MGIGIDPLCSKHSILDEKKQQLLTPELVLQDLQEGNERFCSDKSVKRRSLVALSQKASEQGQFPKAVILACMDSRSIPELVFDQSIGDIFTLRIAGNVVNDEMIASMEFATKHAGAKLIVIMGHTNCGAIKATCTNTATGLESLVSAIKPAVLNVQEKHPRIQIADADDETMKRVAQENVRNMKERVLHKSPTIRELIRDKNINLVGALHNLESGVVDFTL